MRTAFAIPAYGQKLHAGHLLQAGNVAWLWSKTGLPAPIFTTVDTCDLAKGRNILLWNCIQAGIDVMLFCDADTYWPGSPAAIVQMLSEGIKRDAAVIGAPVKMRKRDGYAVGATDDMGQLVSKADFLGRVIEVRRLGTAFTAINLQWIRKCWPKGPWFKFEQLDTEPPTATGEDYWFCKGIQERGGLILADGRFEPVHVGATDETGMLAEVGISTFQVE